jgi:hypothetical protein
MDDKLLGNLVGAGIGLAIIDRIAGEPRRKIKPYSYHKIKRLR